MMKETPNISDGDVKTRYVDLATTMVKTGGAPLHRADVLEEDSLGKRESRDEEEGIFELIDTTKNQSKSQAYIALPRRILRHHAMQKLGVVVILFAFLIVTKSFFRPSLLHGFFTWMEEHPAKGVIAYILMYPFFMVLLIPALPLVFGAAFMFKTLFGWVAGVILCSILTLLGSLLGSIACFFLGRYWIRETVRRWSRKYPLFDAIDSAVSDNGFKIMCYLYLTPILPLALASYMVGTTSMPLKPFALAKIAALPYTALHVYVGAAAGTLITHSSEGDEAARFKEVSMSPQAMILGIIVSIISVTLIGKKIKLELQKVGWSTTFIAFNIFVYMLVITSNSICLRNFFNYLPYQLLDEQKGKEKDDGSDSDEDTEISKSSRNLLNNVHTRQRHFIPKSGST